MPEQGTNNGRAANGPAERIRGLLAQLLEGLGIMRCERDGVNLKRLFWGYLFGACHKRDINSPRCAMLPGEQIVTRTTNGRAQCLLSLLGLNLSFSLKREFVDAFH